MAGGIHHAAPHPGGSKSTWLSGDRLGSHSPRRPGAAQFQKAGLSNGWTARPPAPGGEGAPSPSFNRGHWGSGNRWKRGLFSPSCHHDSCLLGPGVMQSHPRPQCCEPCCWNPHTKTGLIWFEPKFPPTVDGASGSCLALKVINQLFNYLAAPGKKTGTNEQSPSKGVLAGANVPHCGRGGMASTEPRHPPKTALPQPPGGRSDPPFPQRAGAENNE